MVRPISIPRNVDVDDNLAIVIATPVQIPDPTAPSAATLQTLPDLTWQFTTDGWNPGKTQETKEDPRLALQDVPESPGKKTHSLEVTYFYGHEDNDDIDSLLVEGAELFVIARDSVAITEDFAAAQLVDIRSVIVGDPVKNVATGGKQTKTVKLFVQRLFENVALVA